MDYLTIRTFKRTLLSLVIASWFSPISASAAANNEYLGVNSSSSASDGNYQGRGATGNDSITLGKSAKAENEASISIGYAAFAKGSNSLAIGRSASVDNSNSAVNNSVAIGHNASVKINNSIALGYNSSIKTSDVLTNKRSHFLENHSSENLNDSGQGIVSVGSSDGGIRRRIMGVAGGYNDYDAVNVKQVKSAVRYISIQSDSTSDPNYYRDGATGVDAIAIGKRASSSGREGLSFGVGAKANGDNAIAFGSGAIVGETTSTPSAISLGQNAKVNLQNSLALGYNSLVQASDALAANTRSYFLENHGSDVLNDSGQGIVSFGTASGGIKRRLIGVAGGYNDYDAVNVKQVKSAVRYISIQSDNTSDPNYYRDGATGVDAIAIGKRASSVGREGLSFGVGAKANGDNAIAFGSGAIVGETTSAPSAISLGQNAKVNLQNSLALGYNSLVQASDALPTNTRSYFLENHSLDVLNDSGQGIVSFGTANGGVKRRIMGVAGGYNDYDAVNVKQVKSAVRYISFNSDNTSDANYYRNGATGTHSIAIGKGASSAGGESLSFGIDAQAKEQGSLAIGRSAISHKQYGLALGYQATTREADGVALGRGTATYNQKSIALGSGSQDQNYTQNSRGAFLNHNPTKIDQYTENNDKNNGVLSIGNNNLKRRIIHLAAGSDNTDAVNVEQLTYATRYYGVNTPVSTSNANYRGKGASGSNAIAIGSSAQAVGHFGIAIGHNARAEANNSLALGFNSAVLASDITNTPAYLSNEAVNDSGNGVLSIGTRNGLFRRIIGVAGGAHDNDAVNVKQLKAVHLKFQGDQTINDGNTLPSVKFDNEDLSIVGAGSGDQKFITTKAYGNKVEIDLSDRVKALLKGGTDKLGYKVNNAAGQPVELSTGLNFVAATDTNQATDTPKKGIALKDKTNGQIEFGLDKETYTKIQNAASKDELATKEDKITRGSLTGGTEIEVSGAGKLIDNDLNLSLKDGAIAESKLNDVLKQKLNVVETVEGSKGIQVTDTQTNSTGGKNFVVSLKVDELINELTNASAGLNFKGNTDPTISKALGQTLVIKGETSGNSTALESATDNLFVVANNDELVIKLAKALKGIQSITSEAKVGNKAATTVSLTENGVEIAIEKADATTPHKIIIGKDGKITGLEKGEISSASKEAINGAQLNELLSKLGSFTIQNGTVTLEIPTLTSVAEADKNPATMSAAITALDKALGNVANNVGKANFSYKANGGNSLTTTLDAGLNFVNGTNTVATVAADGVVTVDVAKTLKGLTSVETVDNSNKSTLTAQGLQTVSNGHSSTLTDKSLTFNNGNHQPALVVDGENRRITGLASTLEGTTDAEKLASLNKLKADNTPDKLNSAASVGDLAAVASAISNQGLSFEGDDKQKINRTLGSTLKLTGEGDVTGETAAGNLKVEKNATSDGLEIKLAKDLVDLSSATFKNKKDGDQTKLEASGVTVGDPNASDNKSNAQLTKQGLALNGKDGKSIIEIGGKDQNGETKPEIAFAKDDAGKGTGVVSGLKDLDENSDGSLAANKNYVDKKVQDVASLVDKGLTFGADDKQGKQALGSTLEVKSAQTEIKKDDKSFVGKNLTTSYTTDNAGNGTISVALNERPEFKEVTLKSDESKSTTKVGTTGLEISDEKGDKTTLSHNKLHFTNNNGVVDGLQDVADDADGSTAINKNYAEHIQNNVPLEYADSETGKKLVYVDYVTGDGKAVNGYYLAENVRPNGKLKSGVDLASAVDDEKVVLRPANNKTRIMSNVKAGVKDTDAVNVKQLKDVKAEGLNFAGNDTAKGDEVHRDLGQTLTIKGEENASGDKFNSTTTAAGNIKVEADKTNHTLSIKLSDKLKGLKSVTAESDKGSTEMTGDELTMKDKQGDVKVAIKSGATPSLEFAKDKDGNGTGVISGLKAPTKADDAVNKHYVDQLQQNNQKQILAIDNRVTQLAKDVNTMNRDLRAGIAGATAIANLPQASRHGQSMGAIAVGSYRGQSSVAVGLSRISDNGNISFKASGSADTQGHINIGAGVGWAW